MCIRDSFKGPKPDFDEKRIPKYLEGLKDLNLPYALYRAEVDYLDGALCDLLEHERVAQGLVAFTADHGESFGQHGVWWDHGGLYPDTVHIPLIMRWPGGPEGEIVNSPVRQMDIAQTMLAISGVQVSDWDGVDLRDVAQGSETVDVRYMLSAHNRDAAIQLGSYLLILGLRPNVYDPRAGVRATGRTELYNLTDDPYCETDLLLEELEVATDLRAKLIAWLKNADDLDLSEEQGRNTADEAALEGLGYAAGGGGSNQTWWDPAQKAQGNWEQSPWHKLFADRDYPREQFRQAAQDWPKKRAR